MLYGCYPSQTVAAVVLNVKIQHLVDDIFDEATIPISYS